MDEKNTGTGPAHVSGTTKGEEVVMNKGKEAGREDTADNLGGGETEPVTTRKAKDATGVNPDAMGPIDPASPDMPPA